MPWKKNHESWSRTQVNVFVNTWEENINLIESILNNKGWGKVKDVVVKYSLEKTVE